VIAWFYSFGENHAPIGKRELHDVLAAVKQNVERVVDDVWRCGSEILEEIEARPALFIERHQLAIDRRFVGQRFERCGDVIESFCQVVSASGIEGDPAFRLNHFQPVAVEFQFICPAVPLRYFGDRQAFHRQNEFGGQYRLP